MPEPMEWLLLALVGGASALAVAWPLLRRSAAAEGPPAPEADADHEARAVRHRLALEAVLDVEADRRAGSLDGADYEAQRSEAEARAAMTRAALEVPPATPTAPARQPGRGTRRAATFLAAGLSGALVLGFALPSPIGLAERTIVNQALADAIAREDARQALKAVLLGRLAEDASDAAALSELADVYLAGPADELPLAAQMLQFLIALEPENGSAYRRLISAYIAADDWPDARAALGSYAGVASAQEPDIPFFRGLIALRGDRDPTAAVEQFDRFLELAPNDDRAPMVRSLRAEAAGAQPGVSPAAAP